MKVNIHKHQAGGAFVQLRPLFSNRSPQIGQGNSQIQQSSSQQNKKSSLLDDESETMLKKGGLTSDYYDLIEDLGQLEESPLSFIDPQVSGRAMRSMRGKINEMINNKEIWQDSVKTAKQNGSYNEIAVSEEGSLYYKDNENNIRTTNIDVYKKSKEKKRLLTVSELLDERQQNKQLAFNQNVFNVANQSVGLKQITDHVLNLFETLSSYSDQSERTYNKEDLKNQYNIERELLSKAEKKPTREENESIQRLVQKLSTPGEFIKEEIKVSGKGRDLNKALNYIWKTLGSGAQKKLSVIAAVQGETPTSLIGGMLQNYGAQSTESTISPEKESAVKDVNQSSSGLENLTAYQMFHKDKLKSPMSSFAFNDPSTSLLFSGSVGAVGPLMTKKDESIGLSTIGQVLGQHDYNMIVDGTKTFFGNKKLQDSNLNNVIYDGQSAAKVYMPIGQDGMPDYESFEEFKQIYNEYEKNKENWTTGESERYFAEYGYKIKIDDVFGEKVIRDNQYVKPFLVMYGYTNDATNLTDDNPWIKKLSSEEENSISPILEQIWTIGSGKKTKNITPSSFWGEDYYKGIVTIPYRPAHAAIVDALVKQGPQDKTSSIQDVQRNINYSSNQPLDRETSSSILNNN